MTETNEYTNHGFGSGTNSKGGHSNQPSFRLIILAALRNKQLLSGSKPRIEVNPLKRRSTSIAVEEVKRGLVNFRLRTPAQMLSGKAAHDADTPWGNARV